MIVGVAVVGMCLSLSVCLCVCFIFSRVALYQASVSRLCDGTCRSVCLSKVHCGKTAEWIRMPLGMVSGVGRGMGVLDRGGDRRRERAVLGLNLGHL